MKTIIFTITIYIVSTLRVYSQRDLYFKVYGSSDNFWSNAVMQLPVKIANGLISKSLDDDNWNDITFARLNFLSITSFEGHNILDKGNYFGFKAKDIFCDFQYGFKTGWHADSSFWDVYFTFAYIYKNFQINTVPNTFDWRRVQMHNGRAGVGVKFFPTTYLLDVYDWSPIFEVGLSYNYCFSASAPYDNNRSQFNNGFVSTIGIGVCFDEEIYLMGGIQLSHYSIFNKGFTYDDGTTYPYSNIGTKDYSIYITLTHNL